MNLKKSMLALLLALCLLVPTALAEAAALPETAAAVPEIGESVHGFKLIETRDYPLMDAVAYRFEHEKTGAQLYYIANDDPNRAFNLGFFTEAIDNTGLPHVFEHATIQGSEKYPGEQMYFNLSYQTYNTYMNAATEQWLTTYPLASLSEAQLLKLAEFYTDACFYPVIMENERIFRTEAWRYRLENAEDDLTIEGTVYSEMLGAQTLARAAGYNLRRAAFPGAMVGNDSGGDPAHIPEMTWQALRDYHDRYYHPSNSAALLYGDFEDYTAFLALLDGYYSRFERREFVRNDAGYTPITAPVVQSLPFPMEAGANTEHASIIDYAVICPGLRDDPEQALALDTMTDLLTNDASDFMQRLREAMPYGSFGTFIDYTGPEYAIVFRALNVDPGDAEAFVHIVEASVADVAAKGFPQALVDGTAASLAISARLMREGSDPVNSLIFPMLDRWANTGNPWNLMDYQDALFSIDQWNREGRYAQAAQRWLVGSQTTALVTTYPEAGAKEAQDAALAKSIQEIKAGMTDGEIAEIVAATNAEPPEDHSAEYVARLKAVTVESLPETVKRYPVTDETDENGVRRIDARASVDGVSQVSVLLDASGLAQEDIHWFTLYTELLGELDTAEHTRAELKNLWARYLYGGAIYTSLPETGEESYRPCLRMTWIALDDDLAAGYDLMREVLYDSKLDDADRLLEQVQSLRAGFKSSVTADPLTTLIRRGLAPHNGRVAYSLYASGLDYYVFLGEVEKQLADDPAAVSERLAAIRDTFNNRKNAVTMCAGNAESIAKNRALADAFLASLDDREIVPAEYAFPVPEAREALVIDGGVQYNLLISDLKALGLAGFDGGLDAISSVVSDAFLVPLLRDQYGVYTPWSTASEDYLFIYAYRDPNISETFGLLEALPDMIAGMELDQDALDGYIMNAYSGYAMPQGELSGAAAAALDVLEGKDPARTLEYMRELKRVTPETVREAAGLYARLAGTGARMTAGPASAVNAEAEQFDAILNPFGVADNAQVALVDAPEGSDHYEAVRFAFEAGLMAAPDGETFGVDAPATQGDLLSAALALIGGPLDAEEALATFSGYGLAPADADLDAPVAPEDVRALFSAVAGEDVDPWPGAAPAGAITRAELAEALMAFAG